ncbi:MAG: type 2 isopentenyl-diphosphate Delta-isomerase [Deltaproteobacteria bacterium]|nr:MAG: type 2 isopentenyl-diphosphate Delta-isomerase [Deltaproteobacteria bacterium]
MHDDVSRRKSQHLDLVQREEVEPAGTDPLFRCVRLVHRALPELRLADVDLSAEVSGARLRAPLMVVGMTGGTDRAGQINRDLARIAEEEGIAFGVGSMRVLLDQPELLPTFDVRPARPPRLFANLGAQQLVQRGRDAALRLIELIGADGIAIHLNPAQELVQDGGDRDFTGCLDAIARLAEELGERLIVKETGCGIGPDVVRELIARKVRVIDVSGAGGTSWTRVEQLRAQTAEAGALGELLSDWGLPTAACIGAAVRVLAPKKGPRVRVIASGGVRSGLDVARALALGADLAGFALPMVRAHQGGGIDAARAALHGAIAALRAACLLVGARDVQALRASRPVLLEPLPSWIAQLEPPP